jgi:hypothetical protein
MMIQLTPEWSNLQFHNLIIKINSNLGGII